MFKSIEIASFRRINLFGLRSTETPSRSVEPERRSLRFHLIPFKQKIAYYATHVLLQYATRHTEYAKDHKQIFLYVVHLGRKT